MISESIDKIVYVLDNRIYEIISSYILPRIFNIMTLMSDIENVEDIRNINKISSFSVITIGDNYIYNANESYLKYLQDGNFYNSINQSTRGKKSC